MANPKIQVDVALDASKLKKGAADAEKAIKDVDDAAGKLGQGQGGKAFDALGDRAQNLAKEKLGPLGDIADDLGVDLDKMSGTALAAGAGIAAMGAFAAQGVAKFTELADSVRKVHDISGLTYDESSRLVAISDDLGISAETTAASMGRLAKNIDAGKLEEYGIQVVRTKDGAVDMAATLGNVADRMNATVDPTKRAAMGSALFGKAWADMAPVLEQGGAGIRDMMAAVSDGQIVTEENAQAAREWSMALDDAQDAVSELQMSMAKDMLPTLALMAKDFAKAAQGVNSLKEKSGGLLDVQQLMNPLTQIYNARLRDQADKAEEAAKSLTANAKQTLAAGVAAAAAGRDVRDMAEAEAEAADQTQILEARTKDATEAVKDMTAKVKDQTAALDIARESVMTVGGVVRDYQTAQLRTAEAADTLAEKQADATKAVNEFGEDSPEATKAQRDYEKATIDAVAAADDQAHAAANQAEKLAIAAGETFTAEQKNIVYRDSLNKVRDATTDPNFVAGMDNLIALTGDAAANADIAQRKLWDMAAAASAAALAAAGVGRTQGGDMATVTADNADRILSNQRLGGVTVQMDGYRVGELVTQRQIQQDRATR